MSEPIAAGKTVSDPKRRRWHWSTWIIVGLLAIASFLVNFPACSVSNTTLRRGGGREINHGWPLVYRVHLDYPLNNPPAEPVLWSFRLGDSEWNFGALIVDLLCAAAVGVVVVFLWERRRRKRGSIWRFSLREALALMLVIAIGTGCWKAASDRRQDLVALLRGTSWLPSIKLVPRLPLWLRQLVGDEKLDWFPFHDPATQYGDEPIYVKIPERGYRGGPPTEAEVKLRTETLLKLVGERPDFFGVDLGPQWTNQEPALDFLRRAPTIRHVRSSSWTSELIEALSNCDDLSTFIDVDNRFDVDGFGFGKKKQQLPTTADARTLRGCRHLKTLVLPTKSVTAQTIAILADLPELESLEFRRCPIGRAGWEQIGRMKGLRRLSVAKCELTDADMEPISHLPRLEELDVKDSEITDAGIGVLAGCASLWRLDLTGTDITNVGLARLSRLPQLENLSIANTHTNDAGLAPLSQLTSLQRLDISATDVNHIEQFNCATIPRLRSLAITYCPILRSEVAAWPTLFPTVALEEDYGLNSTPRPASITYNDQTFASFVEGDRAELCHPEVTNETLRDFVAWAKRNPVPIRQVMLDQATISDDGLALLRDLPEVTEIDLSGTAITPAGIARLGGLRGLEIVGLDPAQLDERSVAALKALPHLKEVHMWTGRTREAKRAVKRFKKDLPQLEYLPDDFDGPVPIVG